MMLSSDLDTQHVGTLWLLKFSDPLPPAVEPRVPTAFRRAGQEDLQELAVAMGQNGQAEIERRWAAGKQCYIGNIAGKLAVYGWVTFDVEHIGELGLKIRLQPGEAYIWDCETTADFRGQRLYPALLSYMLGELRALGLRRVWIGADTDNVASQKGMALTGFQPVFDILIARDPAASQRMLSRGHAAASEQDVKDAHFALFGE